MYSETDLKNLAQQELYKLDYLVPNESKPEIGIRIDNWDNSHAKEYKEYHYQIMAHSNKYKKGITIGTTFTKQQAERFIVFFKAYIVLCGVSWYHCDKEGNFVS